MSDIIEGLGSAAEGTLTARAAEAEAGSNSLRKRQGECLNCGTLLTGAHCVDCGQKGNVHRSLATILHDLVHGVLHLDGKLWRTLPLLAWKPGELTRRYINGERAKFVSPMAMFLFSVFMMFATFQLAGISTPATLPDDAVITLDSELSPEEKSEEKTTADKEPNTEMGGTGIEAIDQGLIKKWNDNPGLMLYKLQTNAYKFSWLLIPLSIPAVWVLFFWKRRFKAYDHAIFVTYSLAFMSLLFIVLSGLMVIGVPAGGLMIAGIFIPIVHIFRQLRGSYELSRRSALWRTFALSILIHFVVIAFLWLLLTLGAL